MFKILTDKNPALRTKCEEFSQPYTSKDIQLLKDMVEYLKLSQDDEYAKANNIQAGVGLALPQIGVTKRGFAIYLEDNNQIYQFGFINPKILRTSVKEAFLSGGEGCLSVAKKHEGFVYRYNKVVLQGYDVFQEKEITVTAYGYLAICIQHEYDHLNGVLYYDHIDKKEPFKIKKDAIEI